MLNWIFGRFIRFDDVVGHSDELSYLMLRSVEKGDMTERRAFEIKQQLTEEFNQGKV